MVALCYYYDCFQSEIYKVRSHTLVSLIYIFIIENRTEMHNNAKQIDDQVHTTKLIAKAN